MSQDSSIKRFNVDVVNREPVGSRLGKNIDLLATVAQFNSLGLQVDHYISGGPAGHPSFTVSGSESDFQTWLDRCYNEGETASEYEITSGSMRGQLAADAEELRSGTAG